jgi:MOSC domain-containing protein YiiM
MRITSVNVGMPAELATRDGVVMSGIVKRPVDGPVRVGRTNLDGDGQADLSVHGGVDMAVYAYPGEHYPSWARELGRDDLTPGFFGENLTLEGLSEDDVRIGDRLRMGTALLEVSQPRLPCFKLAARSGAPAIAKAMMAGGRTGWYLRVVEEGVVAAGDAVTREGENERSMTVREIVGLVGSGASPDDLDRGAALGALTLGWRESFAQRAVAARGTARRARG